MNFNLLSDKIVFNSLKLIKHGFLEIQNHDSKIYKFGNESELLRAKIKINKPGLTLQIIKSGSVGLAEAYMRNEFETDNLTNLIEITAKNIKIDDKARRHASLRHHATRSMVVRRFPSIH